ncbi:MAG: preprotein translocase subunit SecG [Hyphomonadaceae bacterium]|nr:preprotein translocase subunit SecG [Hyphomonadaceae bacterium]
MSNVLLIILLIISIILIGLILIQRSEGGALGIGGGGGGGGGLMSGRGTADLVTKMTAFFGTVFMVVCLLISISFNFENTDKSLLDTTGAELEAVTDQKTEIDPLNTTPDSAKDDTPLADDNSAVQTEEKSDADTEEQPQDE